MNDNKNRLRIVPAMDLIEGRIVRLRGGDFNQPTFYGVSSLTQAKQFYEQGFRRLHIVDLDGARLGALSTKNLEVLKEISAALPEMLIDYSGGVCSRADVTTLIKEGAEKIIIGSIAVTHPKLFTEIIDDVGAEKIVLAADVKNALVHIWGWQSKAHVTVDELISNFLLSNGQGVMVTDISKDGMLGGCNIELYQDLISKFPSVQFIASGGITNVNDLQKLNELGISEAIIGKALYENRIDPYEVQQFVW